MVRLNLHTPSSTRDYPQLLRHSSRTVYLWCPVRREVEESKKTPSLQGCQRQGRWGRMEARETGIGMGVDLIIYCSIVGESPKQDNNLSNRKGTEL